MAEKVSTLILKVDLECCRCTKKIKKIVCKLQEREKIQTTVYDEKKNTVKISGPFDAERLKKKLLCMACNCKVITDIQIPPPPTTPAKPPSTKPSTPPPQPPTKLVAVPYPYPVWPGCCRQPCPCPCPWYDCQGRRGVRRCCSCGKEDSGWVLPDSCRCRCRCGDSVGCRCGCSDGSGGGGGCRCSGGGPRCHGVGYNVVCVEDADQYTCTIM